MRACARYPAQPGGAFLCRSCLLVKFGGTQVHQPLVIREAIARLSAFGGLGPPPFGDRSARFAKLLANEFWVVLSMAEAF
jgi:hypothetical protein